MQMGLTVLQETQGKYQTNETLKKCLIAGFHLAGER